MSVTWNRCSVFYEGNPCKNLARRPAGSKCSTCFNRSTREKLPDNYKNYSKKYYEKNTEKLKEKSRNRYKTHRKDELDRHFLYRYNNKDKTREYDANVRNPRRKAARQAKRTLLAQAASQAPASFGLEPTGQPES